MGYSDGFDVSCWRHGTILAVMIPVSNEMVLNYLGQHVLGLPPVVAAGSTHM